MKTIIIIPSEAILLDARRIFGTHLVMGAWLADTCEPTHSNRMKLRADVADYKSDDGCIALPTHGQIMLEFLNGRKVTFSTSEWAFISPVEDHIVAL